MAGGEKKDDTQPILSAIVRRNVSPSLHGATQEALSAALHDLQIVRLDREGIRELSNLELVKQARSLYLQANQIKKIENVEVLKNLQFLSLSGNKIENIQNLHCLQSLQFLDLSNNLIQKVNAGELPQSLLILDMSGNPCTKTKGYRQEILEALPHLRELDGVNVRTLNNQKSVGEGEKDGNDSDDSSLLFEESDLKLLTPAELEVQHCEEDLASLERSFPQDQPAQRGDILYKSLSSLAQDMQQRSHQRRKRALREHEERLAELNESRDGQTLGSSQVFCSAVLPGISHHNIDLQDKASSQTKSNTIKSNKNHQAASSLEKNTKDFSKVGKAVLRNQTEASRSQSSKEVSTEKTSSTRSLQATPSSNAQTKSNQTSKHSADMTRIRASSTLKEKQTTRDVTWHTPEKTTASKRSTTSAPQQRSTTNAQRQAVSSKKL